MQTYEQKYADLVRRIKTNGERRETRNAPTVALFGETLVVDELMYGFFPILHGRHIYYRGVLGELAAFLRGPKHLADFERFGCNYWKLWAEENGDINVDYGNKWRDFNGVDQLGEVVKLIETNPTSRRILVSGWDPASVPHTSLPCCHLLYQWFVHNDGRLDMTFYMRSVDVMVGLPSDVVLAAALNCHIAAITGLKPGRLIFMLGDTHIYESHLDLSRDYLIGAVQFGHMQSKYSYETEDKHYSSFYPNKLILPSYDSLKLQVLKFDLHA